LTHAMSGETMAMRIVLPVDPAGYSAGLYAALHRFDHAGLDRIIVETPPDGDGWLAVRDRLKRAATADGV
jgi:L-threonylcarbamoyladenylate synthase